MRSKASIAGHPIHTMLVSFPIALFVSAFLADVMAYSGRMEVFTQLSGYLVCGGLIFGLLAAIAGTVDYIYTVPAASSAHDRATKHGILNVAVMLIFGAALYFRNYGDDYMIVIVLEGIGVVLLGFSSWLGGGLVYHNQIGVNHKYANAGEWTEERLTGNHKFELKGTEKLGLNQMKLLFINNRRVVLGRTEKGLVAFDDRCTHKGASLADGVLICGTVQCPWHGSQFDTQTGKVKAGPAFEKISTYTIESVGKQHFLLIGSAQ